MRLFFHLVDNQDTIHDVEGVEVNDLGQAEAEALRALAEMRQEDPLAPQDWSGWTLRVTDSSGQVVLSLSLNGGVH
jgi:hypothetical protein